MDCLFSLDRVHAININVVTTLPLVTVVARELFFLICSLSILIVGMVRHSINVLMMFAH